MRAALPCHRLILGLDRGESVSVPAWFAGSHAAFIERLEAEGYPCVFGQQAERRGELYYTFVETTDEGPDLTYLPSTLGTFLDLAEQRPGTRHNLAAIFAPHDPPASHEAYETCFWRTLRFLHEHDTASWPADAPTDPADSRWEFAFAGRQIFVFGGAPSYRRRRSRNLGPGLVMLFQPRHVFAGLDGRTPAGLEARRLIRRRMLTWDGVAPHPDLDVFGEPSNHEWKQYFLSDSDARTAGSCPLHIDENLRSAASSPRTSSANS